jgi:CHASE2 domain-containing sensor protein
MLPNDQDDAGHSNAAHRRAHLWFELKVTLGLVVLATVFKIWLEYTPFGHALETQAHVWLHSHLDLDKVDATNFPVTVVDLAELKPAPYEILTNFSMTVVNFAGSTPVTNQVQTNHVITEWFTPRAALRELVEKIADAGATAIGVDIDMSLEPSLSEYDKFQRESEELYSYALEGRTNIYFGVKRNDGLAPEEWLGKARLIPLAVSLARPIGLVREMPSTFVFPDHTNVLRSLSRALADSQAAPHRWHTNFARAIAGDQPVKGAPKFSRSQYFVDYSPLTFLISNRVTVSQIIAGASNGFTKDTNTLNKLKGKLVLLGDATPFGGGDSANIPEQAEPVPGVYVHASGVYTLIRAPLYRLQLIPGVILAALGSLAAVALIYAVCFRFAQHHSVTTVPLTVILTVVLLGLFILLAILLVNWLRILWLEVLVVCVVLIGHCFIDVLFGSVKWERFRESVVQPLVVVASPGKEKE